MSRHFVSCMNIQEQARISCQEVVPECHCHLPVKFHHPQGLEMDAELSTDRARALCPSGNRLPLDQWLARSLRHSAVQPSSHSCRRRQCSSTTSQNALLPFPCSSTSPAAVAMPTDTMYSWLRDLLSCSLGTNSAVWKGEGSETRNQSKCSTGTCVFMEAWTWDVAGHAAVCPDLPLLASILEQSAGMLTASCSSKELSPELSLPSSSLGA